ncbi:RPM1-interacting protein 4 isoform X3 [Selaginella moellendorffii]|uniref:RPM1-interacting protein 4 isoform X3 n=1 Tax=Selaginella moellendorffii TaxID=88036 RepID=UPI000D1CFCD8|nr:RPM1-interacting protein 4 isoform X3 [Selaginella moellendorffii]|eukprot:XP_024525020.1 RPM1-interacting protein 4 isoform X3 [Selaginella moellendorffii]
MAKKDQSDVRRHLDHSSRRQSSTERSPLHPQVRNHSSSNRTSTGSPAWEKKNEGGNNFAPSTPGRSRMRANPMQEDQEKGQGPPLPKFGAWDPKDPSSADGFTIIFNKARDEKRAGSGGRPASPVKNDSELYKNNPDRSSSNKWYCCFGAAET